MKNRSIFAGGYWPQKPREDEPCSGGRHQSIFATGTSIKDEPLEVIISKLPSTIQDYLIGEILTPPQTTHPHNNYGGYHEHFPQNPNGVIGELNTNIFPEDNER